MILSPVKLLFFSVETSRKLGSNVFWKKSYLKVWSLEGTFCLAMSPARKLSSHSQHLVSNFAHNINFWGQDHG